MLGPTAGLLPWEKLQAEVGFDVTFTGNLDLDTWPLYLHAKIGTPESSFAAWSPAIAAGIYNVGIKSDLTTQNVAYGLLARTLPFVGRLSAGYYYGNGAVLKDGEGRPAQQGWLVSWDRYIKELSDKLWVAVDFQSGHNALGALSAGLAWYFTPNMGVLMAWDHYLEPSVAGKDTITLQVDVTFGTPSVPAQGEGQG
jgi:hypothetical protein